MFIFSRIFIQSSLRDVCITWSQFSGLQNCCFTIVNNKNTHAHARAHARTHARTHTYTQHSQRNTKWDTLIIARTFDNFPMMGNCKNIRNLFIYLYAYNKQKVRHQQHISISVIHLCFQQLSYKSLCRFVISSMSMVCTRNIKRYDMQQHRTCLCACQHRCYTFRHDLLADISDLFLHKIRLSYASVKLVHLPFINMKHTI